MSACYAPGTLAGLTQWGMLAENSTKTLFWQEQHIRGFQKWVDQNQKGLNPAFFPISERPEASDCKYYYLFQSFWVWEISKSSWGLVSFFINSKSTYWASTSVMCYLDSRNTEHSCEQNRHVCPCRVLIREERWTINKGTMLCFRQWYVLRRKIN